MRGGCGREAARKNCVVSGTWAQETGDYACTSRAMGGFGVVSAAGPGGSAFDELSDAARTRYGWAHRGAQELIWTAEPVDCQVFETPHSSSPRSRSGCAMATRVRCSASGPSIPQMGSAWR